jgi:hypothetical protein
MCMQRDRLLKVCSKTHKKMKKKNKKKTRNCLISK